MFYFLNATTKNVEWIQVKLHYLVFFITCNSQGPFVELNGVID